MRKNLSDFTNVGEYERTIRERVTEDLKIDVIALSFAQNTFSIFMRSAATKELFRRDMEALQVVEGSF